MLHAIHSHPPVCHRSRGLQELLLLELEEPSGWVTIPLEAAPTDAGMTAVPLSAFFLQVAILTNHQNGRDTHVREVRVFGPRRTEMESIVGLPLKMGSTEFSMYAMLK